MNLLLTVDKNYVPYMNVMLYSLLKSNPDERVHVYILHSSLKIEDLRETEKVLSGRGSVRLIEVGEAELQGAPVSSRYPREMYYRIFASKYLPRDMDRILYLDPDIIVKGSLCELYGLDMGQYYFAAASHTGKVMTKLNELRLDLEEKAPYINSGVMLMNLELLRKNQDYSAVFQYIRERKNRLLLPDQDIISGLYGKRIYSLDPLVYNMTERMLYLRWPFERDEIMDWVWKNTVIIHYCGRNKPWKENYTGELDVYYRNTVEEMKKRGIR